jgi:hypothetical protein
MDTVSLNWYYICQYRCLIINIQSRNSIIKSYDHNILDSLGCRIDIVHNKFSKELLMGILNKLKHNFNSKYASYIWLWTSMKIHVSSRNSILCGFARWINSGYLNHK